MVTDYSYISTKLIVLGERVGCQDGQWTVMTFVSLACGQEIWKQQNGRFILIYAHANLEESNIAKCCQKKITLLSCQ